MAALAGFAGSCRSDEPSANGIFDNAAVFRPEIAARANAIIRDLHDRYGFDVRIETLTLADNERAALEKSLFGKTKNAYFAQLGQERAKNAELNGVNVLICTNPWFVQVSVYPDAARTLFSRSVVRDLHRRLDRLGGAVETAENRDAPEAAAGFGWRARPPAGVDAALIAAMDDLRTTVQKRVGDPNAVPPLSIGIVLAAGVGVWCVLTLLSRRMTRRAPESGILRPMQPDRGPALLAAQFGSPSAYWIYDRLFYGPPAAPAAATVSTAPHRDIHAAAEETPEQPDLLHGESNRKGTSLHDELQ
jgi:hypothetical protein